MSAFRILLGKELLESWRTFRLPIVLGLFVFVGLTSPLTARFLPEIIEMAGGGQLGVIELPTPTTADAVDQLVKNTAQFGALAAILLSMGLVAGEKDRGTAAFILAKPVRRGAFLGAKLVAVGLVLAAGTAVAVVVGWIYTAILFEPVPVAGWVALAILVWLVLFAWASLTFLGSVLTGSSLAAGGIGFVALLVLGIVAALPNVGRFTPNGLLEPATALATGRASIPALGADLWVPLVSAVVLISATIGLAGWSFGRQEL
jgi:ABC-2 type transport system permease protein